MQLSGQTPTDDVMHDVKEEKTGVFSIPKRHERLSYYRLHIQITVCVNSYEDISLLSESAEGNHY